MEERFKCTECGKVFDTLEEVDCGCDGGIDTYKFCGNCEKYVPEEESNMIPSEAGDFEVCNHCYSCILKEFFEKIRTQYAGDMKANVKFDVINDYAGMNELEF